jgi:hypothetical protein
MLAAPDRGSPVRLGAQGRQQAVTPPGEPSTGGRRHKEEKVPDGETTETVSREAFDRVKHDNEQLKAQLDQLRPVAEQTLLTDTAYEHFKTKGVADPYGIAKAAARDSMFSGVEKDDLPGKLDSWLESVQSAFGGPPKVSDDDGDSAPAATPPPPGAARPAPSPAGSGGDPKPEPLRMTSPEVLEMKRRGDQEGLRRLVAEGRLQLSPNNPMASRIQGAQ